MRVRCGAFRDAREIGVGHMLATGHSASELLQIVDHRIEACSQGFPPLRALAQERLASDSLAACAQARLGVTGLVRKIKCSWGIGTPSAFVTTSAQRCSASHGRRHLHRRADLGDEEEAPLRACDLRLVRLRAVALVDGGSVIAPGAISTRIRRIHGACEPVLSGSWTALSVNSSIRHGRELGAHAFPRNPL